MALKLMYITNNPQIAEIAQKNGVDRIFIDLEYLGKKERQKNINSVKSDHSIDDIVEIKKVLKQSELLVRVNPINPDSKNEIDTVIDKGAQLVMLPMWESTDDVEKFIGYVNKRAKTILLLETKEAADTLDEVLKIGNIDEIYIGLNDLHLSYKRKFMFELLADETVHNLIEKIKPYNIAYGFGGLARIGMGMLPAEYILAEHYMLGSQSVILSRSFCNANNIKDLAILNEIFSEGIGKIRELEKSLERKIEDNDNQFFIDNHEKVKSCVNKIISNI